MADASKFLDRLRVVTGASCLLGAGLAVVPWHALARSAETPRTPQAVVEQAQTRSGLRVVGLGEIDPAADASALADRWLAGELSIVVDEHEIVASRQDLGAAVDVEKLAAWLADAVDEASPLYARLTAHEQGIPVPFSFDPAAARSRVLALKLVADERAVDARFEIESQQISPEKPGRLVDVSGTLANIEAALALGRTKVEASVVRDTPKRFAAELAEVSTAAVLGEFETRYNIAAVAAQRTANLRVAAQKVDGVVLLPGEVFDFNAIIGERNEANGFRPAPVIAAGEITDGVGGGICQISGTLHAAALFAGLEIVERAPHSRPSSYIKLGLDAMVTWPRQNFVFRNDRAFPVVLRMTVSNGIVRTQVLGPEKTHLSSFVRRIDGVTPFTERVVEDPSLPTGVRVLDQRGVPGFRLTRFRIFRDPVRNIATRERSRDVYPPTVQIVRVGTGGPAPEGYVPPPGDNHPEYRADGYLILTQGAGLSQMQETSQLGSTGIPGWTIAAGMPPAPE